MRRFVLFYGTAVAATVLMAASVSAQLPDPVVYYPFDTSADDASGNNHHGVLMGPAGISPGRFGTSGSNDDAALDLGDVDSGAWVEVPADAFADVVFNDSVTISLWINGTADQPHNNWTFYADPGRQLGSHAPWSDSNIYFDVAGCCGATQRISAPISEAEREGRWNHFAYVKDLERTAIYVNGNLRVEGTGKAPLSDITQFSLGAFINGGDAHGGLFDDFRLYDVPLTQAQIQEVAGPKPALQIAGVDSVGRLEVSGVFTPTEVTRLDNPVDGLFMQVYAQANFGSKGNWDNFLAGLPVADGEGIVEWINWDEGGDLDGYLFAQPILDALDPNADPLNFDASNYNARLTGELLVESTGDILFKDGNDDFTYFALDQDGDGEIGAGEVLINDNAWTQWDGGSANGGSPIATANITGDISGENGWRKMEFLMGEGGGDDNAALFWSENAGGFLDEFTLQTDPLGVPELVPPENFRTFMEQIVSAANVASLDGETLVFDILVEQLEWDRLTMSGSGDNILNLDGSEVQINVVDPDSLVNGFTVDMIRDENLTLEGAPTSLTFLNTDPAMWDTSNFATSGQLTYTGGAAALAGDFSGDGFVGQDDLDLVLLNWGLDASGGAPDGWVTHRPDGNVGQEQLDLVLLNWGEGSQLGQGGVPEPSTIVMLLIAAGLGLGLIRR